MADAAQVIWDAGLEYRAFYLPAKETLHLVSGVLADEEIAVELPGCGLLLLDENREFRAAELRVGSVDERQAALTIPVGSLVWKERFASTLPASLTPKWDFDPESGYYRLELSSGAEDHWIRLGEKSDLWIGANEAQVLSGIAIGGIERDPDGAEEAAWLEELVANE